MPDGCRLTLDLTHGYDPSPFMVTGWSGLCGTPMQALKNLIHFYTNLYEIVPVLLQAGVVVVNITGGTTAMQHIVQQVAAFAEELGRPVRRAALLDRRSPQEQRDDPYVPGELIWLDRERRE